MTQQRIEQAFRHLLHLLHASDVGADERQAQVVEQPQVIMELLPEMPLDDQYDIWAALYALDLVPDRRTGQDRRLASGKPRQKVVFEERRGERRDRRQPRNVARWIGNWN